MLRGRLRRRVQQRAPIPERGGGDAGVPPSIVGEGGGSSGGNPSSATAGGRDGWDLENPHGWFRRGLGILFIFVGIAVIAGWDKDLQTWVIENSPIRPWELDSEFIPRD